MIVLQKHDMKNEGNIISGSMNEAINRQIGREFAASLQYISMATYFDGEGLTQLSDFFYRQADEERDHVMRFVKYLVDAGGHVAIPPVAALRMNSQISSRLFHWHWTGSTRLRGISMT